MFAFTKEVKKKYFIAIVLKEDLLEKAERLKLDLFERHGLRGALRSPSHITLHRPFEWKEEKENDLINILSQFKWGKKMTLELNNFSWFEPRVIFIDIVRNELLFELHKSLIKFVSSKLGLLNEAEDLRGFHPHITIAFRDLKKPLFYHLREEFETRKLNGGFNVTEICLLKLEEKWKVHKTFSI